MGKKQIQQNKKIKNSQKVIYDNINFDSKLELNCYKLLKENNIDFFYNTITFELLPSFRLDKINYFSFSKAEKLFKQKISKKGLKEILLSIKYTPDFIIKNDKVIILIETKGFVNDVYPYKKKLLFKQLEEKENRVIYFFEPRNKTQILETINIINKILND